ncbi:MAG: Asp-tRNA(Asn)/Glu-tRNA(Gln) amidotransferase subunit GatC [Patescibacteria group bacterium]
MDITKADIESLAALSRIELTEEEKVQFAEEAKVILSYIADISGKISPAQAESRTGALKNVMRADEVSNTPGEQTQTLLDEAPHREGDYLTVKKIIAE